MSKLVGLGGEVVRGRMRGGGGSEGGDCQNWGRDRFAEAVGAELRHWGLALMLLCWSCGAAAPRIGLGAAVL